MTRLPKPTAKNLIRPLFDHEHVLGFFSRSIPPVLFQNFFFPPWFFLPCFLLTF